MELDYSKEALLRFLKFVGDKGLVNSATARNWRVAVTNLFVDLTPDEEVDVRKIDIDVAARKFANRQSGIVSPVSLTAYRQRASLAVREFASYVDNPAGYKPRGLNGKTQKKENGSRGAHTANKSSNGTVGNKPLNGVIVVEEATKTGETPPAGWSFSMPLRKGTFMMQMVLPRDLTMDEAKRIGTALVTMVETPDAVEV